MPTYQKFNDEDKVASTKTNTYPLWSDSPLDVDTVGQSTLTAGNTNGAGFFTSSAQTASFGAGNWDGNYYLNIFAERVDVTASNAYNANAEPQFSIAYGLHAASASADPYRDALQSPIIYHLYTNDQVNVYSDPQKAIYKQFANILTNGGSEAILQTKTYDIETGGRQNAKDITYAYFITIARNRMKDGVDPTTWNIVFQDGTAIGAKFIAAPGAKNDTQYDIVRSGSTYATEGAYGSFYPNKGIFVFDAKKLHSKAPFQYHPTSSLTNGALFSQSMAAYGISEFGVNPTTALRGFYGQLTRSLVTATSFTAESYEVVTSTHYFVRVKNKDFNATENPTWRSGSNNEIREDFMTNPTTFITTVGLYDGASSDTPGNLVAIAKLSKPIMKSGDTEALIRVRLDF